jgi:hypothetical protein
MVEHARQRRLVVKCHNCNNGMDPLIGTIVVASTTEVENMYVYWHDYQPEVPRGNDTSSKKRTTNQM